MPPEELIKLEPKDLDKARELIGELVGVVRAQHELDRVVDYYPDGLCGCGAAVAFEGPPLRHQVVAVSGGAFVYLA